MLEFLKENKRNNYYVFLHCFFLNNDELFLVKIEDQEGRIWKQNETLWSHHFTIGQLHDRMLLILIKGSYIVGRFSECAGGNGDDEVIVRIGGWWRGIGGGRSKRNGFTLAFIETFASEWGFDACWRSLWCGQQGSEIESGRDVELGNGCQRREFAGSLLRSREMAGRIRVLEAHHQAGRMRRHWTETQRIVALLLLLLLT